MFAAFSLPHLLPILAAASLFGAASAPQLRPMFRRGTTTCSSAARLIAARARDESGGRVFRAGVEIKLKAGWKTYWRYPGDSGVPPVLDFSESENVKAVTVLYPAPMRFPDGAGGNSIGYKGDVILPLHVVPQDAGKPVTLRSQARLCGVREALRAGRGQAGAAADRRRERATTRPSARPRRGCRSRAAIGDGGTPSIRAVRREAGSGKPRVVVDVAAPAGAPLTLFAEGPTAALGAAAAGAGRRRARGHAALRVRTRWPAARREARRRHASADGGVRATRRSRSDFGSTNSPQAR